MSLDIIKLLPDSVANQIAAGEVIQRPASAVKEMLENSIDAGATQIDLVVKDAGKTMIMVVDNGCGMSETDARLCFERHATSKIQTANDLFAIRTMGFRGEALASIAAVAQVELKTRRKEDEYAVKIVNEGSVVKEQTITSGPVGTTLIVKNLFFNVPARRGFLKTNTAEMRHIVDVFTRVTMMNPEIGFTLTSDGKEMYHLYPGNLKQRIVGLMGNVYDERLLPVRQETEKIKINGYIVKSEYSKKTRGDQYFFVNKRFIKHPYLNHAVEGAYMEMIPKDNFPGYFINIDIDPAEIDINIHPTKTEVNFLDQNLVYAVLHAAVRKAIGQHNLSSQIDFDSPAEPNIDFGKVVSASTPLFTSVESSTPSFNPFRGNGMSEKSTISEDWRKLYGDRVDEPKDETVNNLVDEDDINDLLRGINVENKQDLSCIQINNSFIAAATESGLLIIDQHAAHERILFEKYLKMMENTVCTPSQQELFPIPVTLSPNDVSLLKEIMPDMEKMGFVLQQSSPTVFMIMGTPTDLGDNDPVALVEQMLENQKHNAKDVSMTRKLNLAITMATRLAVKENTILSDIEMQNIVNQLFSSSVPEISPSGKKIMVKILNDEILTMFD